MSYDPALARRLQSEAETRGLDLFAPLGGSRADRPLLSEGERRRETGLDLVADHNLGWLARARKEAERVARQQGEVTVEELRRWADEQDDQPNHPNAWGTVFRGNGWRPVGYRQNGRESAHARRVVVWALSTPLPEATP